MRVVLFKDRMVSNQFHKCIRPGLKGIYSYRPNFPLEHISPAPSPRFPAFWPALCYLSRLSPAVRESEYGEQKVALILQIADFNAVGVGIFIIMDGLVKTGESVQDP